MKVDCSALARSRNRHPYSQSSLSAYLLIRVSPSDIRETLHASMRRLTAAVRDFHSKKAGNKTAPYGGNLISGSLPADNAGHTFDVPIITYR